ncbi:MAG: ParB/RepB/Spo0J family partition protein [Dehalococcoidia bacterium]
MTRTRGLGRGLEALIPATAVGVDEVDVDLIVPNPHQPRAPTSDQSLDELVESMREHGVLQPLIVTQSGAEGVYQLIAGERRLRAARIAGLSRVPVVVKDAASKELLEIALVENLQREDLNVLEEANAFRRLAGEFGMTQEEIAKRVGRSRTAVANAMRLLALSDEIKASVAGGAISEGHARALLGLDDEAARHDAWRQVQQRGLTVRQTEKLVRTWRDGGAATAAKPAASADPETAALEERLRASVGTKVELRRRKSGRGRLVLHFYSDEELEGLLGRLGVSLS